MDDPHLLGFHGEHLNQVSSTELLVGDPPLNHKRQLVPHVYGQRNEQPNFIDSPHVTDVPIGADNYQRCPSKDAENFYSLSKEAHQELWPGILRLAIPNGANLPKSYVEAKVIGKLGVGYVKVDACLNHCQLLWKDKGDDDTCSICGAFEMEKSSGTINSNGGGGERCLCQGFTISSIKAELELKHMILMKMKLLLCMLVYFGQSATFQHVFLVILN
ncbi:hypothetical protein OROHE_013844 [Orobanche hederae]